jgi:Myosin head (motor domain)
VTFQTYSGLFLVAINPYQSLPLYSDTIVQQYRNKRRDENPPHIFAVAERAWVNMGEERENQSILITCVLSHLILFRFLTSIPVVNPVQERPKAQRRSSNTLPQLQQTSISPPTLAHQLWGHQRPSVPPCLRQDSRGAVPSRKGILFPRPSQGTSHT